MHRNHRLISLLLSASILLSSSFSGCSLIAKITETEKQEIPTLPPATTRATSTPTPSPTPTPDPDVEAKEEALATAGKYGLPEESLRGKYDLFRRYSNAIDTNGRLGDYVPYMYNLFPVIADHLKPENESYFLAKVNSLRITSGFINEKHSGEYSSSTNVVKMNRTYLTSENIPIVSTIMHELMHFVDSHIDGPIEKASFTKENVYPIHDIPASDNSIIEHSDEAAFFMEAGAELYTAKYFMHYSWSYRCGVQFLTGMEYIFGSDLIDEAFFCHDSAWFLADLLQKNGFSIQEIWSFYTTMDCMTYKRLPSEEVLRPEDVLIRLYEKNIDGDYKTDKTFCHILRCINSKDYDFGHFPSPNEEFLSSLIFSDEEAKNWTFAMFDQTNEFTALQINGVPISGIFLDGKYTLSGQIRRLDDSGEPYGPDEAALFDYDFETGTINSFELYQSPLIEIKRPEIK